METKQILGIEHRGYSGYLVLYILLSVSKHKWKDTTSRAVLSAGARDAKLPHVRLTLKVFGYRV